jgi:hypothetical protein
MSTIKTIIEGTDLQASVAITKALNARAAYLIEQLQKDQDLVRGARLVEQRNAPDNEIYPLTRREVEKMLSRYERREDDSTGFDNPEPRSIDGAKKARWYAPEHNSNYLDDVDTEHDGAEQNVDDRPSKLMPYDYYFSVHKPKDRNQETSNEIGDVDTENDEEDWEGETNKFFIESIDDAHKNVEQLLHDSTKHSYPVEFHLDDDSYVTVHPQQAQHIINSGKAGDILNHITSTGHFQNFLDDIYNKGEGVGHG